MPKRVPKRQLLVDGRRVSPKELQQEVQEDILRDYMSAGDLQRNLKLTPNVLNALRETGKVRAVKRGGRWYYSREDLQAFLKAEPTVQAS